MSQQLYTTTSGRLVKDARGRAVPEKFAVNEADPFWAKLIRDRDIVRVDAGDAAPVAPAAPLAIAATKGASS